MFVIPITMCADFCNDDYDDAVEYGFDVLSIVEQGSLHNLEKSRIEKLPNVLQTGRVLCITASTSRDCQSWALNLLCGSHNEVDIAFHFNPRLIQHYIVRNTRLKGQWGNEEALTTGRFKLKHDEEFQLKIFTADDQFFVTYNGTYVCSYGFRVPLSHITHIEMCGLVDLYKCETDTFEKFPQDADGVYAITEINGPVPEGVKMETPIRALLSEEWQQDWQLEIYGTPKILPQSFTIGLKSEIHIWPPCTIPLQMKAYFGNNKLVRNAFIDNKWGMEERIGGFKFLPACSFSLWIRRGMRKYSIWVNEKLQAEFAYRCAPDMVRAVHIQGDLDVTGIYMNKSSAKYFKDHNPYM